MYNLKKFINKLELILKDKMKKNYKNYTYIYKKKM